MDPALLASLSIVPVSSKGQACKLGMASYFPVGHKTVSDFKEKPGKCQSLVRGTLACLKLPGLLNSLKHSSTET